MSRVEFSKHGNALTLRVKGKPDASVAGDVRDVMLGHLQGCRLLRLETEKPLKADAPFLQVLCSAWKAFRARGVVFEVGRDLSQRAESMGLMYCQSCLDEAVRGAGGRCPVFDAGQAGQ